MSEERGEAFYTAQEAKRVAEAAHDISKSVSAHLGTIAQSLEGMRKENTDQHRENGRRLEEGMSQLHSRVSSIKKAQDEDRVGIVSQFADVEKSVFKSTEELKEKIISVRDEAKKGDDEIKEKGNSTAIKVLLAAIGSAGSLIVILIGALMATGKLHIG